MFPLQPTGFFNKAFSSMKQNANEAIAVVGASATNAANCYDPDPSTFGELQCIGGSTSTASINFTGTSGSSPAVWYTDFGGDRKLAGFLLYHSPTSGLVAATAPQLSIKVVATATITSVTKGVNSWPDVVLQVVQPGTNPGSPLGFNELIASGSDANIALSGGGTYSVSIDKTINYPIYGGIDTYGMGIIIGWKLEFNDTFSPSGSIVGTFDAKIYDVNTVWP